MWVRSSDGELVRADSIVGLRFRGGEVEALWREGWVRLAGPGCPPEFHAQLAERIAFAYSDPIVIVTADVTAGRSAWTETTAADLAAGGTQGWQRK